MENLAHQTAVSIQTGKSSGSGTIVRQEGQTYTVLTNWHVVAFNRGDRTILTGDALLHPPLGVPRLLGDSERAIVLFRSANEYKIALFTLEPGAVSEPVLAVGFPAGAEVGALAVTLASFRCRYPNLCLKVIAWAIQMRLKSA
ncbi:hypothetical protein [Microcoleus sp. F10B5]|uniref:hypothetical protein n=1 Tax=Microcoleus sp. F10B5 TaxID=3055341 RepID=UPI002FD3C81E